MNASMRDPWQERLSDYLDGELGAKHTWAAARRAAPSWTSSAAW
jgi:hypothetical protein